MKTKIILIILCTLVLAACGSSSPNQGSATSSSPTPTNTASTPTSAPAQHFHVGQSVSVGDTWQVTVVSAKTSPHGTYSTPQHVGDVFLIFQLTVKNISTSEQNISSLLQFQLTDSTGQKYTSAYDDEAGANLDGKVEAGSPLKGSLVYEVPGSVHDFRLAFSAEAFQSGQTIWDITV